jgi:hypothetical protein
VHGQRSVADDLDRVQPVRRRFVARFGVWALTGSPDHMDARRLAALS